MLELLSPLIDPLPTLYLACAGNALATGLSARAEGHSDGVWRCHMSAAMIYGLIGLTYMS